MTDIFQVGSVPEPPPTIAAPAAPTATSERLAVLDVLRGFAPYGVLLANTVFFFSGLSFMARAEVMARADVLDQVFLFFANVLVDGKAMMMLTFLFGLGFALQLQRAEAAGRSGLGTYLRENPFASIQPVGRPNRGKKQLRFDEAERFITTALQPLLR